MSGLVLYFPTAAEEHARVGLGRAQRGEELRLSAADVPVAGVVAGGVAAVVRFVLVDVGADVGVALVCAVGAVSVGAVYAGCVCAGGDVVGVLPLASTGGSGGSAAQTAALSPAAL